MLHYLPHLAALYIGKRLCDYLISKTERIAANSLGELVLWAWRRWINPKGNRMSLSKQLPLGPLTVSLGVDDTGQAKAAVGLSLQGALGGGKAAGVVKGSLSISGEVDVDDRQVIDLGVAALETLPVVKNSPLAVAALEALKAELEKVLAPAAPTA